MSKKVAIVGTSDTKHLTPFGDLTYEVWGVNNLYPHIPRATRWFEIHQITSDGVNYLRRGSQDFRGQNVKEYLAKLGEWTKEKTCPVYMQSPIDLVPTSVQYPIDAILNAFPRKYFTNTVSYELALAIVEGFDEIHLYGIDMAVDNEYYHQRPSVEYFLGIAEGKGIKVYIPPEADLLKTRFLYAFEENQQTAWEKKCKQIMESMAKKKNIVENELKLKETQFHQYIGAMQAVKELDKIWK